MKLSNRSSSLTISQSDIYSRFLDMHEELTKSSQNINNLIDHSLKQLASTREASRISLSANSQNQQELNSFEEMAIEEDLDSETQPQKNERELVLENKIKIYESSLIKFEQENLQKDREILRLKKLLNDQNLQITMQNPDEIYQEQSVIRQKLQVLDGQLDYLQEKKEIRKRMKEWEIILKEQSEIIKSQKLEISRLKHINSYLHKSIEKLQTL
ncbi:unnamed protein product (macronuclear) [Paramecium tetraurelia]|uniref:Uncharacterized protein n=1 Tax=Paramecium tetraurelia TaxID=5888 RepID=A0E9W5_PARTE|nr:uncharacterized protein GSPATT00024813001 [Paramecium tetraurelia]CAK92082.1 unnamed protein product [Paramecium tetraurelia]|eukprot:XP_001459479.1 hypothetical protein (macronuclear) [Paramecium tetraurelia strain d4-2]